MAKQLEESDALNPSSGFIDKRALRAARRAEKAALLAAAALNKKPAQRPPSPRVTLSTPQQEQIRRQADAWFRVLRNSSDCTEDEKGRLLLTGKRSVAQILGDVRADLDGTEPITKTRLQEVLRRAIVTDLRIRRRQSLAPKARLPRPVAEAAPAKPRVVKSKKEPKHNEPDVRRQRRDERRALLECADPLAILTATEHLEREGDWYRAATLLLQLGDERIPHLARIGRNFLKTEAFTELTGNLAPYIGRGGVSAEVPVLVGIARLHLHQYERAVRAVEPSLQDADWGAQARIIAACGLLMQERPWLAREILEPVQSPVHNQLRLMAELSVGLLAEDTAAVAQMLDQLEQPVLTRELTGWQLNLDADWAKESGIPLTSLKVGPASYAKSVVVAEALLRLNQPEQAVMQVFNVLRVPTPVTAHENQMFVRGHVAKAKAYLELASQATGCARAQGLDEAFAACARAVHKRPTDRELLQLAADISDSSGSLQHRAALAILLTEAQSVPETVKAAAEAYEPVAADLEKAFRERGLAKIERPPHRPSLGSRRVGGFNFVRS